MIAKHESILAVDPGTPFGWAFFPAHDMLPSVVGVETQTKGSGFDAWMNRSHEAAADLSRIIIQYKPTTLAIEWPQNMAGSAKGIAAAERGDIIKLSFTIGRMVEAARRYPLNTLYMVPVAEWMGQMSEEAVKARVARRIEQLGKGRLSKLSLFVDIPPRAQHPWDAVGIGLYARGQW